MLLIIADDFEDSHSQRLRENFEILNAIRLLKSLGNNLIFVNRKFLWTEHMDKGTVDNRIGLSRRFLPKKTDLNLINEDMQTRELPRRKPLPN